MRVMLTLLMSLLLLLMLLLFNLQVWLLLMLLLIRSSAACLATLVAIPPAQNPVKHIAALAPPFVLAESFHEDIVLLAVAIALF